MCSTFFFVDGAVKRDEFYEALKIIPKEIFLYVVTYKSVLSLLVSVYNTTVYCTVEYLILFTYLHVEYLTLQYN